MTALRYSLITEREVLDLPREAGAFLLCLFITAWLHLIFFVAWEALAGDGPGILRPPAPMAPLEIVVTLEQEPGPAEGAGEPGEAALFEEPAKGAGPKPGHGAEHVPEHGAAPAEAEETALEIDPALARLLPEEADPSPPPVRVESEPPRFKSYNTAVRMAVAAKWLVPPEARVNFQPGRLVVNCTIGRDGALIRFVVDESTGNSILDHAGLEALRAAAPFPPFPPELAAFSQLDITMIFDYQARYLRKR